MTTTHRYRTGVVLALALAAASAPAASARPVADTSWATASAPPGAVYSRQDKLLIRASQTATDGAAAGRAALARSSAQQERQRIAALSAYRAGQLAAAFDVAATSANRASAPQATVQIHTPESGFDWGDAGIGAAGGLALSIVGLGGALAVSQHRTRRTGHTEHTTA